MDAVEEILQQWRAQRPELDTSPMGVIGRISRLAGHIAARQRDTFARHDLDPAAFDVLATLRRAPAPHRLTPAQLSRAAMVSTAATAQRLNRLERDGLVTRRPRPDDARGLQVTLTDRGVRLVDETLPDHLDTERRMLSGLTDADQRSLAALLSRLLEHLEGEVASGSTRSEHLPARE